jgi:hypothetical protein
VVAIAIPQKAAKWICGRFQHGNGTAIIRWRWLADPQAGVRDAVTNEWSKGIYWSIWQWQVVYGEEVTSISKKGFKDGRRRRCVGDGEKNEETDCQRLLSGESQASSGHWLFRLLDKLRRYST